MSKDVNYSLRIKQLLLNLRRSLESESIWLRRLGVADHLENARSKLTAACGMLSTVNSLVPDKVNKPWVVVEDEMENEQRMIPLV